LLETPVVTKFRQGILEGNWEMVKRKLFLLLKDLYYFDALLFLMNFDFRFTRRYWSWASMIRCTLGFGVPLIFWWKGRAGSLFLQSDQFCLALILAHQVSHWAAEIPWAAWKEGCKGCPADPPKWTHTPGSGRNDAAYSDKAFLIFLIFIFFFFLLSIETFPSSHVLAVWWCARLQRSLEKRQNGMVPWVIHGSTCSRKFRVNPFSFVILLKNF